MASISQGLVLTTAMVVSSTVLYLGFLRQKSFPLLQIPGNSTSQESNKKALRSCLCSGKKKKGDFLKKRVQFADNVKEEKDETTRKEIRGKQRKKNRVSSSSCRIESPEIRGMPQNRIALYNGILRDRVHRLEYSC
ncbi:putative transmembrane protein [Senna tora]|uniref:Putative transmembrane protein n=1 Tax=Senna tora TaxID=362788 RepID=A0A834WAJ4_9FABA|nr:putative transmembrane protein [Senna tora]